MMQAKTASVKKEEKLSINMPNPIRKPLIPTIKILLDWLNQLPNGVEKITTKKELIVNK